MKTWFLVTLFLVGTLCIAYPRQVAASPADSIATLKEIPSYFYVTSQQLSDLLTKSIQEVDKNMPVQDLRVHLRHYEENCDHVFFTFRSGDGLYVGIGELKESRVKEGQLVTRTSVRKIDRRKPFEIQYAFSGCFPSLAGAVNDPSITWIDMVEGDGKLTRVPVYDGLFFRVLDHGINIYQFQYVRFEAADRNNHLVASINGSDLYPKPR